MLPECVDVATNNAKQSGGSFRVLDSMEEAFKKAHVVYPKSWAPMNIMKERKIATKTNL